MKRWVNIRDAYLKSLRKQRTSKTPIKPYTYGKNLVFLNQTYDLPPPRYTSSTNSSSETEPINFVEVPAKHCYESDDSDHGNNSNSERLSGPNEKRFKEEPIEAPEPVETDRHILFFKGILPSLRTLTEDEVVEFQMRVLELVINIKRNRLQCN